MPLLLFDLYFVLFFAEPLLRSKNPHSPEFDKTHPTADITYFE